MRTIKKKNNQYRTSCKNKKSTLVVVCSAIFLLTTWWISHGRVGLSLSQRSNKAPLCGWFGWYTKCKCQQRCYELRYVWYMWMSCVQKLEEKMTMALTCSPRTARGVTRQPDCHERHTPIRRTPINILKTCCCTHSIVGMRFWEKGGVENQTPLESSKEYGLLSLHSTRRYCDLIREVARSRGKCLKDESFRRAGAREKQLVKK